MSDRISTHYIKEGLLQIRDRDFFKTMRKRHAIFLIKMQPFFGQFFENKSGKIKFRRPSYETKTHTKQD